MTQYITSIWDIKAYNTAYVSPFGNVITYSPLEGQYVTLLHESTFEKPILVN